MVRDIPRHCFSRLAVRVRFGEVDLMGIVHHAQYLSYFELGRIEYLRRRGLTYRALIDQGLHLAVISVQVAYKKPARFDDALLVETRLTELGRVRVEFGYRLLFEAQPDNDTCELATGRTVLACIDDRHAPRRIPEDARERLLTPEG